MHPDNSYAFYRRGYCYFSGGVLNRAIDDYTEGIRNNFYHYFARAQAYYLSEQYVLACADCTEALERNPKYLPALVCRGNAYLRMGEIDEGIADLRAAGYAGVSTEQIRERIESTLRLERQYVDGCDRLPKRRLGEYNLPLPPGVGIGAFYHFEVSGNLFTDTVRQNLDAARLGQGDTKSPLFPAKDEGKKEGRSGGSLFPSIERK